MKLSVRSKTSRMTRPGRQAALSAMFSLPFELGPENQAPAEFRIFKAGDNPSEKGTFVFDAKAQELVLGKYAERGVPMMMDYEHQSTVEPPVEAPASAKSFVPQVRNGELWATEICWTDRARSYLEAGEYRLFSPAFGYEELDDGRCRVTKLINVALTNNPALHNIEPLMAAKDKDDDMDEELKLLKAENDKLKAENASLKSKFDDMEGKLKKLSSKKDDDEEEAKATAAALTTLRDEVKSITGKADLKESVGVLRSIALKAKSADDATARLTAIEAEGRDKEFVALLDDAHKEGKISPAHRKDFWEKKCRSEDKHVTVEGLAMLKDWLPSAQVQINLKQSAEKTALGIAHSQDEKHVLARMGLSDPDELKRFEEFRAASGT